MADKKITNVDFADSLSGGESFFINKDSTLKQINKEAMIEDIVSDIEYGANKILWTGTYYMNNSQTITLSEAISAQPYGVIFVWSYYESGEAMNQYYNYKFVPKWQALSNSGRGVSMFLSGTAAAASHVTTKYLYISDTTITGYTYNYNSTAITQTGTDIKLNPSSFVLRYVIGV